MKKTLGQLAHSIQSKLIENYLHMYVVISLSFWPFLMIFQSGDGASFQILKNHQKWPEIEEGNEEN